MPKIRSPNRDKAYQIYKEKGGNITNKELAVLLHEKEKTISNWKCRDKWNIKNNSESCSKNGITTKKRGGQKGNKNAINNKGGSAPLGNKNNYKHGLYSKLFYSSLTADEIEMLNLNDLNEIEELRLTINLCDIQMSRFLRLMKEAADKGKFTINSINNSDSKDGKGKLIESVTTTCSLNTNELLTRYNAEIERIKKQKIRCLELLTKLDARISNKSDSSINIKIGDDIF